MGEMEEGSNYMMYQNADLKDLHSTDGSTYGYVHSEPVAYVAPASEAGATVVAASAGGADGAKDEKAAAAVEANGDEEEPKEPTELEKYWKAVKENPHDFTGWTYLLQFVEQENNLDNAREAFQKFFKNYPYCYGYWKKYADLEKKNQNIDKCIEVFEQGLTAIPLSVDLWQHYIAFYRTQETGDDSEEKIRALFEKALKATGLEFRSDRLWEMYVAFETELKNHRNTMSIFDRLISTPTQLYSHQYEIFEEFVRDQNLQDILKPDEFDSLKREVEAKRERQRLKVEEKFRAREKLAKMREEKEREDRLRKEKEANLGEQGEGKVTENTDAKIDEDASDKLKEAEAEEATDKAKSGDEIESEKIDTDEPMSEKVNEVVANVTQSADSLSTTDTKPDTTGSVTSESVGGDVATEPAVDAATDQTAAPSIATPTEPMMVDETVAASDGVGDAGVTSDDLAAADDKPPAKDETATSELAASDVYTCAMPPSIAKEPPKLSEEDLRAIRSRLMETRRTIHKANEEEVSKRWNFEEGIKRPYFHVKPLETTQLNNWREYLDFEISEGNRERICILFERCLIACALYEDMWLKYAKYLEAIDMNQAREVYRRACTIHLTSKPNIQLMWASLEERLGNFEKSAEVLDQMEKNFPGYLPITFRRINLTRRQNNHAGTELLYKQYAEAAKSPQIASLYALKQARFRHKLLHDEVGAVAILNEALVKDKDNARLYMQLIDIYYQTTPIREESVVKAFDGALGSDMAIEAKILFAQRKVEFLEDLGSDINRLQEAYDDLSSFVKAGAEKRKRIAEEGGGEEPTAKRTRSEAVNGVVTPAPAAVAAVVAAVAPAVDQSYGYNWANYAAAQAAQAAQSYNYQNAWNVYGQQYYSQ